MFTIEHVGLHITLGACVFADGDSLQPLLVLPQKEFPVGPNDALIDEFHWNGQEAGWMSTDIFEKWIEKVFIPAIQQRRRADQLESKKALLITDGHASRKSPKTIDLLYNRCTRYHQHFAR